MHHVMIPMKQLSLITKILATLVAMVFLTAATVVAQPAWESGATSSGSSQIFTVSKPDGVQAGDLLMAGLMFGGGNTVIGINPPEGWQMVERLDEGNQIGMAVFFKIATAADALSGTTSYTWTKPSSGGNVRFALGISRISGIQTASPIYAVTSAVGQSSSVLAPSLSAAANTMVLGFFTHRSNSLLGDVAGTDTRYENANSNPNGPSNKLVTRNISESGMTGDWVANGESTNWVGMQIVIKADAIPPPPFAYGSIDEPFVYGTELNPIEPQSPAAKLTDSQMPTFSVEPAFPLGITMDPATGIISGTPAAVAPMQIYTVTASNDDGQEQATIEFEVTSRSIEITATSGLTKVYGETDPVFTYTITSGSMAFSDILQPVLVRDDGEDVGSYSINLGSIAVTNASNDDVSGNYDVTFVGSALGITEKTLTIGGSFEANDKDFDGTRTASFATNALELVGVVASDVGQVDLVDIVIEFDDANQAGEQVVRITSASLDGAAASNYMLDLDGAPTGLAEIIFAAPPSDLTYPVNEINIKYGDVLEPVTPVLGQGEGTFSVEPALPPGLVFDPETGAISGVAGQVTPPGVYTVTVTNNDGSTSTQLTISIEARVVTISGPFEANDKQHDGTTVATFKTNNLALTNVLPADASDVELADVVIAFQNANTTGLQPVTITSAGLGGAKSSNYELDLTGAPSAEAQIFMYSISGVAFIDVNGNDIFDDTESPAANILITAQSTGASGSATTDDNGVYTIDALPAGTYQVSSTLPDGMYQSLPASTAATATLGSSQPSETVDFGFYLLTNLEGRVVASNQSKAVNIDGIMTTLPTSEMRVSGVRTGPAPLKGVAGSDQTLIVGKTDFNTGINEEGYFKVENLVPGVYRVQLYVPEPWVAVTDNPIEISLSSGGFIEVGFVIEEDQNAIPEPTTSSIAGSVVGIGNTSGLLNPATDLGLSGQVVSITGVSDKGVDIQRIVYTNVDGTYLAENLPAGEYTVEINPQNGFSLGWPGVSYLIRLDENQNYGLAPAENVTLSSSVLDASPGRDVSVGRMTIAIDTDLDGKPDLRVDTHGLLQIVLAGNAGQSKRETRIEGYSGIMRTDSGDRILVSAPGLQQELGELFTLSSFSTLTYNTGVTVVIDNEPLYSDGSISLSAGVDSWPVRNKALTMQSEPVNLRSVNGVVKAQILYVMLVSQHGVDFGLEKADYGDAPNSFGTLRASLQEEMVITDGGIQYPNDGPRHLLPAFEAPSIYMGSSVTHSPNGNPSSLADFDSDDDGIMMPSAIAAGDTLRFEVSAVGSGYLHAWFDWNRDGSFDESEKLSIGTALEPGVTELFVKVPAEASVGDTFVRFRYSSEEELGPTGPAQDGEVEDYMFTITAATTDGGGDDDGDDDGDTGTPTNDEGDKSGLPSEFRLGQNYPNPFNPSTVIPFDLAQSGQVVMSVYDVTGRKVATLLNTTMGAGRHAFTFNAAGIPSGVYIVRLEAGGQIFTSKLTLLK